MEIMKSRNLLPPSSKQSNSEMQIQALDTLQTVNCSNKFIISLDLNCLKRQFINTPDEFTKEILQTYGYYNIINQYNKPFLNKDGTYKSHIDFFKLFSLQQIDTVIKNVIF